MRLRSCCRNTSYRPSILLHHQFIWLNEALLLFLLKIEMINVYDVDGLKCVCVVVCVVCLGSHRVGINNPNSEPRIPQNLRTCVQGDLLLVSSVLFLCMSALSCRFALLLRPNSSTYTMPWKYVLFLWGKTTYFWVCSRIVGTLWDILLRHSCVFNRCSVA